MNQDEVLGRYFREKLAQEIQLGFPIIGQDYLKGMNSRQIDTKHNITETLNKTPGKAIYDSILMAIGGFCDLNGKWVKGLIPHEAYKTRTSESQWKSISPGRRSALGKQSNDARLKKRGITPWKDEERYMIWLAAFAPDKEILDERNRVKRKYLTVLLNSEFSNNRTDVGVRNIMTGFKKNRKTFLYNN